MADTITRIGADRDPALVLSPEQEQHLDNLHQHVINVDVVRGTSETDENYSKRVWNARGMAAVSFLMTDATDHPELPVEEVAKTLLEATPEYEGQLLLHEASAQNLDLDKPDDLAKAAEAARSKVAGTVQVTLDAERSRKVDDGSADTNPTKSVATTDKTRSRSNEIESKPSYWVRAKKALSEARSAYGHKASTKRALDAFDPDSPTYVKEDHDKAKVAAERAERKFKARRNQALGATAFTGGVIGLVTTITDKFDFMPLIPESDVSYQEVKGVAAGALLGLAFGATSIRQRQVRESDDVRKDLFDQKGKEIDAYRASKPDDHNFDQDNAYQKLWADRTELRKGVLKNRFSTKFAMWNMQAKTALIDPAGVVERTKQRIEKLGLREEYEVKKLSFQRYKELVKDGTIPKDVADKRNAAAKVIKDMEKSGEDKSKPKDYEKAWKALDAISIPLREQYGEVETKKRLTKRGKVAVGIGAVAGVAAVAGVGYLVYQSQKNGVDTPSARRNPGDTDPTTPTTSPSGSSSSTVAETAPQTSGPSGSSADSLSGGSGTGPKSTVPETIPQHPSGTSVTPEGHMPTRGDQASMPAPAIGEQAGNQAVIDALPSDVQTNWYAGVAEIQAANPNTMPGTPEFDRLMLDALELAAKIEENKAA